MSQALEAQHGCVLPPQLSQRLGKTPAHTRSAAQTSPAQQSSPPPPHESVHVPESQPSIPSHTLPGQHGAPARPHETQRPPEHASPVVAQGEPDEQQTAPLPPQGRHLPSAHASDASAHPASQLPDVMSHVSIAPQAAPLVQHGEPAPPQTVGGTHVLGGSQRSPAAHGGQHAPGGHTHAPSSQTVPSRQGVAQPPLASAPSFASGGGVRASIAICASVPPPPPPT
jgi:hypothetical protein